MALEIKEENYLIYDVDMASEQQLAAMTEEEMTASDEASLKFEAEQIKPTIMSHMGICECRMQEFMERHQREAMISNVDPRLLPHTIKQEDVDQYKFAVVTISEKNKMTGISTIIRECKKCHKIDIWGDSNILAHLIAEVTTNFYTNQNAEQNNMEPADPALFGKNMVMEDIGDEEDHKDCNCESCDQCSCCEGKEDNKVVEGPWGKNEENPETPTDSE